MCVHCCVLLHVSLLVLAVIYARKKYRWCLVVRCGLLSFCTAKEERKKGKRWGPHAAVRSARGPGASALRGANGGGVGARAVAGYWAERASKRDK